MSARNPVDSSVMELSPNLAGLLLSSVNDTSGGGTWGIIRYHMVMTNDVHIRVIQTASGVLMTALGTSAVTARSMVVSSVRMKKSLAFLVRVNFLRTRSLFRSAVLKSTTHVCRKMTSPMGLIVK